MTDYEKEQELRARYDQMIDECYPEVKIGYGTYLASDILKSVDPIAYEVGLSDFESFEEEEEEEPELATAYTVRLNGQGKGSIEYI